MAGMKSIRRGRSWQFNLRFLLIAVALIALGMHWDSERRAIRRAMIDLETAVAEYQRGGLLPSAVTTASRKLLDASLVYPFCDRRSALGRHRNCAVNTLNFFTTECLVGGSSVNVWDDFDFAETLRKADAEIAKLEADIKQAQRWVSAGEIDPLGP